MSATIEDLLACSTLKQAKIVMTHLFNDSLSQSNALKIMIFATNENMFNFDISSYLISALVDYATSNKLLLVFVTWNEIVAWCCHNMQKIGTKKVVLIILNFLLHLRINLIFAGDIRTIINLLILICLEEKDLNLSFISLKNVIQIVIVEECIQYLSPIVICISRFITTSNKSTFERCLMLIKTIVQSNLFKRQFDANTSYNDAINILNSEINLNCSKSSRINNSMDDTEAKMYEKQYIVVFNKYVMSKLLILWNDDHQVSANPKVTAVMEQILNSNHLAVNLLLILNKRDKKLINPDNASFDLNYIMNESSSIVTTYIDLYSNRNTVWLLDIFETMQYKSTQKIIEILDDQLLVQYSSQIINEETKSSNITIEKVINLSALSLLLTSAVANQNESKPFYSTQLAELFSTFVRVIEKCSLSDPPIYLSLSIIFWFKMIDDIGMKLNPIDINIISGCIPQLMKNFLTMPWIVRLSFACTNSKLISQILYQIPMFLDNCYSDNGEIELTKFIHMFLHVMRNNASMIIKSNTSNKMMNSTFANYTLQQDINEEMHKNLIIRLEESVACSTIYHKYWKIFEELVKKADFNTNIRVAAFLCLVEYMKRSISFRDSMLPWLECILVSNIEHDESVYFRLQIFQSWSVLYETNKSNIPIITLYNSIKSTSKKGKILAMYLLKVLYLNIIDESIRSSMTNDYFLAISLPILLNYDPEVQATAKLYLGRIINHDPSILIKIILHLCTDNPLAYAQEINENGIEILLVCLFENVNEIELSRVEVLLTQEVIDNKNLNAAKILNFFNLTNTSRTNIEVFLTYASIITENDKFLHQILIKRVSKKRRN